MNTDKTETLDLKDSINQICPWSGDPVVESSLTSYKDHVVGFCNTGCRDKFERAINLFESSIDAIKGGQ
jgi:hypothetical protein